MDDASFLRRREAGKYLKDKYGFCSDRALGKLATTGGGPEFRKAGIYPRSPVVYERAALDLWALSKIGAPCQTTSDYPRDPQHKCSGGRPRRAPRHEFRRMNAPITRPEREDLHFAPSVPAALQALAKMEGELEGGSMSGARERLPGRRRSETLVGAALSALAIVPLTPVGD